MRYRALLLGGAISLIASCESLLPELPGLFYNFWLSKAPALTVCDDLARALEARLLLRGEPGLPPKHGCPVRLIDGDRYHGILVSLDSSLPQRRVFLRVNSYDVMVPTTTLAEAIKEAEVEKKTSDEAVKELAAQVVSIVHEQLPDSEVKQFRPHYGPFAP